MATEGELADGSQIASGALCRFAVLAGEDGDFVVGLVGGGGKGQADPGRTLTAAQPQMELTTRGWPARPAPRLLPRPCGFH